MKSKVKKLNRILIKSTQSQTTNMNNFVFHRVDTNQNHEKVKIFYEKVLNEFVEKLHRQTRYSQSPLQQNKLDRLKQVIIYKLKHPQLLFQRCRMMKQGSAKMQDMIKNENPINMELKIQHNDEQGQYLGMIPSVQKLKSQKKRQSAINIQGHEIDDEQSIDQFGILNNQDEKQKIQSKKKVKKDTTVDVKQQDNFKPYVQKAELKQEQPDSDSQNQNILSIQQCQAHLNAIIMGTFSANTLKHKPKQQKTSLILDNVFIKWQNGQMFVSNLPVQTNKIQRQHIKQFPRK